MDKELQILVSIGIPFYNSDLFLADAIKSVIKQTYTNWELILMDDGSSDKSVSIAREFESKDTRIKLVSDGNNSGLASRLNQLSSLANGKYYSRMDSDDIMHPDRLTIQVDYLEKHPDVDLLGTGLIAIDNENNITGIRKGMFCKDFTLKQVLIATWCVHPTITGKTEWFKKNLYDKEMIIAEDYDYWIRTVEDSSFVRLAEPYLYYREASTPTLKKYLKSTIFSIKILWKNKNKIGMFNAMKYSIVRISKLMVYFLFSIFGITEKLIQRRSVKLRAEDKNRYRIILDKIQLN